MFRILSAAALAALLTAPALAQDAGSSSSQQGQQQPTYERSQTYERSTPGSSGQSQSTMPESQRGLSGPSAGPADCLPNDPRPECQTAQLPGQQEPLQPSPGSPSAPSQSEPDQGSSSPGGTSE